MRGPIRDNAEAPIPEFAAEAATEDSESGEEDSTNSRALPLGPIRQRMANGGRAAADAVADRRRRGGGPDEGLAASISDELGPMSASEVSDAVADFDGGSPVEPVSSPEVQPEIIAPVAEAQSAIEPEAETVHSAVAEESPETEKAARRRSTVREKVSFPTSTLPEAARLNRSRPSRRLRLRPMQHQRLPRRRRREAPSARKVGWWSRRFGGG